LYTQSNFRLLVVRLGAMGDILHALPAVTALRLAHPGWSIGWVVEPRWRPLLSARKERPASSNEISPFRAQAGGETELDEPVKRDPAQPLVDRVYLAPTKEWGQSPLSGRTFREIRTLRSALESGGYDAVIDFQGAVRSAAIGRFARSSRLIGEARPREFAARWLFTEPVDAQGAHVIEQDTALAAAVAGDALVPAEPWLPKDSAAEAWADAILRATGGPGTGGRPAALITPGAGWGAKRWPVERYAAVAAGLIDRGLQVLVNAGPGEEPLADLIAEKTNGAAVPVTGSLDQLIALTRRIHLAVAGDTGPLHLACALGCPVVGIYGPTDPSRNGPFGTRFKVLRSPESRRDHARHRTPEAGMLTILPEDVLNAADELLQDGTRHG
jgi:heptosyltransferase I